MNKSTCCSLGLMYQNELETRRAEIRRIQAMTPLADEPLVVKSSRRRRRGRKRSRQVMRIRTKVYAYESRR